LKQLIEKVSSTKKECVFRVKLRRRRRINVLVGRIESRASKRVAVNGNANGEYAKVRRAEKDMAHLGGKEPSPGARKPTILCPTADPPRAKEPSLGRRLQELRELQELRFMVLVAAEVLLPQVAR
jgi:hypothetical protein